MRTVKTATKHVISATELHMPKLVKEAKIDVNIF